MPHFRADAAGSSPANGAGAGNGEVRNVLAKSATPASEANPTHPEAWLSNSASELLRDRVSRINGRKQAILVDKFDRAAL